MTHHATGTGDVSYDLVSVLYHTLQESSTIQQYIDDAQERGDAEVAAFLLEVQEQDRERAQRAKALLTVRFDSDAHGASGGSAGSAPGGGSGSGSHGASGGSTDFDEERPGRSRPMSTAEPAEG
ncbi:hypothetical protein [Glycomyces albidus]|uniref:hypothetical protein n=1 Tax=Glycomyces albidus TaxID=2656774 RepID=UPI001883C045|nr:hypothetical protein [Glycomyces albidus]